MTDTKLDEIMANVVQNELEESNGQSLKTMWELWCTTSSAQGLPKIFQYQNKCVRTLWLLVFVSFSFCTFYFFTRGILDFLDFEVVSKIRVHNEESLEYPFITLCSSFPFTSKRSHEVLSEFDNLSSLSFDDVFDVKSANILDENFLKLTLSSSNYIYYGMRRAFSMNDIQKLELGYDLKEILQFCSFNGELCTLNDFTWIFSFQYGNCFQFKGKKTFFLKKLSGSLYGFRLALNRLKSCNSYSVDHGLIVFIHNGTLLTSSSQQMFVEMGKTTNIEIKKTFTYRQPLPYSQCEELTSYKSDYFNEIKNSNVQYRQSDCIEFCKQKWIIQECKCFSTYFIMPKNMSLYGPCNNKTEMNCTKMFFNLGNNVVDKCFSDCPLECDFVQYDLRSSSLDYPSKEYFNRIKNDMTPPDMSLSEYRETHLVLNVYFASQEYTEIRETPKMSPFDLISNLGGVLGIFLGLSIITLAEVMEILILMISLFFRKRLN